MWLTKKEGTGAKWRFLNGYRDAFATKHPRISTIVETSKKRMIFVKARWLPCSHLVHTADDDEVRTSDRFPSCIA